MKYKYVGHEIQNEILELMAHTILWKIIDDIKYSNFFSFFFHETRDVANVEQGLFGVHLVNKNFESYDDFLGN